MTLLAKMDKLNKTETSKKTKKTHENSLGKGTEKSADQISTVSILMHTKVSTLKHTKQETMNSLQGRQYTY